MSYGHGLGSPRLVCCWDGVDAAAGVQHGVVGVGLIEDYSGDDSFMVLT